MNSALVVIQVRKNKSKSMRFYTVDGSGGVVDDGDDDDDYC